MKVSPSKPNLVVSSASTFWTAREAGEIDVALGEFAHLKGRAGDSVEIGSVSHLETFASKFKRQGKGLLKSLPTLALGAGIAGLAAAGAGIVSVPAALGWAAAASGGLSLSWLAAGLGPGGDGLGVQHSAKEPMSFPELSTRSSPSEGLQEMVAANMQRYPTALHVVHLSGHGLGAKAVGGIAGREVKEALSEAVRGRAKLDVGFYETCYGANYEFLHGQAEVADYAVAFEDAIPKSNSRLGRLPLSDLFAEAAKAGSGRGAAVSLAVASGRHFDEPAPIAAVPFPERLRKENREALWTNTDSTAVAVDLTVLREELSPALDRVGKVLSREWTLAGVIQKARRENLLEDGGDLVDLGGFLHSVRDGSDSDAVRCALDGALEALDRSLIHKRTGSQLPLSGLSFHSKPNEVDFSSPTTPGHTDATLPAGWVSFIEQSF